MGIWERDVTALPKSHGRPVVELENKLFG